MQSLSVMAVLGEASAAVSDFALRRTLVRIRYPKPWLVYLNAEGLK